MVFIDEISRTRNARTNASWPEHHEPPGYEEELLESYRNGLKALSTFSQDSVLTRKPFPFYRLVTNLVSTSFI